MWMVARLNRGKSTSMQWLVFPDRNVLFAAGGVTLISGLSMLQNRADWLILDKFVGPQILAQYSLSNKIYELIMTIAGLGYAALFAQLSRSINTSNFYTSQVYKQFYIVKLTTIIISILFFLFCSIPLSLFPNFYNETTVKITEILSLMAVFSITIAEMYYIALAAGAYRFLLITSIVTTCIQLLINIYLIEKIGVWGAVVGMGALTVSNMFIYLRFLKSFNGDLHRRTLRDLLAFSAVVCVSMFTKWMY
jgi:O-antigen/teichoic acid export membrane protein